MPELQLTAKERQALKARAHRLGAVVLLGSAGLSSAVVAEIDRALSAHELIKVKVPGDDRAQREEIFATVADQLSAARVQAIGKLLVFFRPVPDETTERDSAPTQGKAPAGPRSTEKKRIAERRVPTQQRGGSAAKRTGRR